MIKKRVGEQSLPPASSFSERESGQVGLAVFGISFSVSFSTWAAHTLITCTTCDIVFCVISCSCNQHLLLPSHPLPSLHTLSV